MSSATEYNREQPLDKSQKQWISPPMSKEMAQEWVEKLHTMQNTDKIFNTNFNISTVTISQSSTGYHINVTKEHLHTNTQNILLKEGLEGLIEVAKKVNPRKPHHLEIPYSLLPFVKQGRLLFVNEVVGFEETASLDNVARFAQETLMKSGSSIGIIYEAVNLWGGDNNQLNVVIYSKEHLTGKIFDAENEIDLKTVIAILSKK